jgi:trans-aconitate methyltransferase
MAAASDADSLAEHWDAAYRARGDDVSWFESAPTTSLTLLDQSGVTTEDSVVDVGGGHSGLVDALLERGHRDLTVLDISSESLRAASARVAARFGPAIGAAVTWLGEDVRTWRPRRRYRVWHDRAALHFLVEEPDLAAYAVAAADGVQAGGLLVVATFAPDGPDSCSGLPVRRHDSASLAAVFGDAFRLERNRRVEHQTPWGAIQPFTWAAFRRR